MFASNLPDVGEPFRPITVRTGFFCFFLEFAHYPLGRNAGSGTGGRWFAALFSEFGGSYVIGTDEDRVESAQTVETDGERDIDDLLFAVR